LAGGAQQPSFRLWVWVHPAAYREAAAALADACKAAGATIHRRFGCWRRIELLGPSSTAVLGSVLGWKLPLGGRGAEQPPDGAAHFLWSLDPRLAKPVLPGAAAADPPSPTAAAEAAAALEALSGDGGVPLPPLPECQVCRRCPMAEGVRVRAQ
jgi:hypothetical protein